MSAPFREECESAGQDTRRGVVLGSAKNAFTAGFAGGKVGVQRTMDAENRRRVTMRTELLRFNGAVERDPAIDAWMKKRAGELGAIALQWFEVMRECGDEVRELLHDGCPVACLGDVP